jgi:hypothetical protein
MGVVATPPTVTCKLEDWWLRERRERILMCWSFSGAGTCGTGMLGSSVIEVEILVGDACQNDLGWVLSLDAWQEGSNDPLVDCNLSLVGS